MSLSAAAADDTEFQYPFVNVPPIVLNSKGEKPKMAISSNLEAYTELSSSSNLSPQTRNYISFLPQASGREWVVLDGEIDHPQRHLLTDKEFISPTIRTIREKPAVLPTKKRNDLVQSQSYTEITPFDEEAMKYYVAGLSVVGLLIFYRFLARTQY